MKKYIFSLISALIVLVSCDDNTNNLGYNLMPTTDIVHALDTTYYATSRSIEAGRLLARSNVTYLGYYSDPVSGSTTKADFFTQFNCTEGFAFPERDSIVGDSTTSTQLYLYIDSYIGDSLQPFTISIYPLDSVINPDNDIYTDIDISKFYNVNGKPIAKKTYTIADQKYSDIKRTAKSIDTIKVSLPKEIGEAIYQDYRKNPSHFKNSASFIKSGLPCSKGVYIKLESGNGAMATIYIAQLEINFDLYEDGEKKSGHVAFSATEEITKATQFRTDYENTLRLIDDNSGTYLQTPSGIFTEVTLPVEDIIKSQHESDTINTVKFALTRYNDPKDIVSQFKLGIPQKVLLIRADSYKNYFERYELPDNVSSYISAFNSANNTYSFNNIGAMIRKMIQDKQKAEETGSSLSPNWNKVYVIPVNTTLDTSGSLVRISHDFSLASSKLIGGITPIKVDIIYSRYSK